MKVNRKIWSFGLALIVAVITYLLLPFVLFNPHLPGYDQNWETDAGKEIAWGPRPQKWVIAGDPERSTFSGKEWYYRVFWAHCSGWLVEHDMKRPTE